MENEEAVTALSALAQSTRLAAFRLLVTAGVDGMPAGAIADSLDVPHNTMSTHLALLTRAGLVSSKREGRSIIYCVDQEGMRALLAFLVADCCGGRPEMCGPLVELAERACCVPGKPKGRARGRA